MKVNPRGKFINYVVPTVLLVLSMAGAWWIMRTMMSGGQPRWWMFMAALAPAILYKGIWAWVRRYDEKNRLRPVGGKGWDG